MIYHHFKNSKTCNNHRIWKTKTCWAWISSGHSTKRLLVLLRQNQKNTPGFSSASSGASGSSSEGTSGSSTSPWDTSETTRDQTLFIFQFQNHRREWSYKIWLLTVTPTRLTWVISSSSARTASSSSCDKEPASISSICCTKTKKTLLTANCFVISVMESVDTDPETAPSGFFFFYITAGTYPLVLNSILGFIHNPFYFFNRHHLVWENSQSESVHDQTWDYILLTTLTTVYLVHLLQTLISNFKAINHFPFNLGKLQVLNLK